MKLPRLLRPSWLAGAVIAGGLTVVAYAGTLLWRGKVSREIEGDLDFVMRRGRLR